MFIAVTRYEQAPEQQGEGAERWQTIRDQVKGTPGWLGSQTFRSTTDPKKMMRITMWESLDVRDRLHASETGQRLGLGQGPDREFYELINESRPDM